jgi:hypothetical protein
VISTRLVDLSPHRRRRAAVRQPVATGHGTVPPPTGRPHVRSEALAQLRRLAVFLETAALLDRQAERSADPIQAAMRRERAEERRRIAEALQEHLGGRGLPSPRPPDDIDREVR